MTVTTAGGQLVGGRAEHVDQRRRQFDLASVGEQDGEPVDIVHDPAEGGGALPVVGTGLDARGRRECASPPPPDDEPRYLK